MTAAEADVRHGTKSGYRRRKCRCDECRAWNAARCLELKRRRLARVDGAIPHGTGGYTNYGCRCVMCTAAQAEKYAQYRRSSPDPHRHGTAANYARGCTCELCKAYRSAKATGVNDRSRDVARNHGKQWTGPEMEIVLRRDLTVTAIAARLGRTVAAVRTMRFVLDKGEPMPAFVAGQASIPEPRRPWPRST